MHLSLTVENVVTHINLSGPSNNQKVDLLDFDVLQFLLELEAIQISTLESGVSHQLQGVGSIINLVLDVTVLTISIVLQ
jgi:hypothetical protein